MSIILKRNGKIEILHTTTGIYPIAVKGPVLITLYTRLFSKIFIALFSKGQETS